jgi:hypothetical protein
MERTIGDKERKEAGMTTKTVTMALEEQNGNAFHLLGAFAANARQQGWSSEEIEAVRNEAMADNYEHLLQTLMNYVEHPGNAA